MVVPSRTIDRLRSIIERSRRRARDEKGLVLVYSGMTLTMLVGLGGFAVDVGNWYLQAQRLQRSADAAALAGSVYLPGDASTARSVAQSTLDANVTRAGSTTIGQREGHPTQLSVSVSKNVRSYFVQLVGLESLDLTRNAVGEYRPYVPMGSPANVLGQEPSNADIWERVATRNLQDNYWLNISAASTGKGTGDRYSSGVCGTADACTSQPLPFNNADFSTTGQDYVVRIAPGTTGTLAVQAYDAGFAHVGDNCTANLERTVNGNIQRADMYGTLYRAGNNEPGCTGDNFNGSGASVPNTTYQLFTPEQSRGGSRLISQTGCAPRTYNGTRDNLVPILNPANNAASAAAVRTWFRRWTDVCRLPINTSDMPAGDYILRVSNWDPNNRTVTNAYTGLNRFALRAGFVHTNGTLDATKSNNISLFSKGRLVVYAHDNRGDVIFYIARIHSGAAGRNLTLTLFDIGDAAGGASLSVLPPTDARTGTSPLTQFNGCRYTQPGRTTYSNTNTGCSITGITSGSYDSRIINVEVPIPSNYSCNDASGDGCWTRLRLQYGSGTTQDTTSWEVSLDGNPVRLVIN
jgi:Flp pilus assembly protein TadG